MTTTSPPYAVLEVSGADAGSFLRAQLTNDVLRLGRERHFLAAWCDAKGRVLCIMRVLESDTGYLLLLPAALAEPLVKRLRMYVLRARVTIADVSSHYAVSAVLGPDGDELPADGRVLRNAEHCLLGLDAGAGPRALRVQHGGHGNGTVALDSAEWQLAEIDAGLPEISAATQGLFVPQMLNLHWLMAIDFDKGCYPGQEVIARLHYRGRLTRRMFRMQWNGDCPAAGDSVVDSNRSRQGTVVRAAAVASGEGRLLAVLRVDAISQPFKTENARLTRLDLPYATPD